MSLDNFLNEKDLLGDHYDKFLKLKEQFIKEKLPENIATYKALEILTPEKLEKIKILIANEEGLRHGITFYFDTEEELKLIGKYFIFNPHTKQVKNANLLIELLKLMENTK